MGDALGPLGLHGKELSRRTAVAGLGGRGERRASKGNCCLAAKQLTLTRPRTDRERREEKGKDSNSRLRYFVPDRMRQSTQIPEGKKACTPLRVASGSYLREAVLQQNRARVSS